jgi:putative polyhydroxyalkanoate system protein
MPDLTISIPHQLPRPEAKRRIEQGVAQVEQQYGSTLGQVSRTWNGDTMDFTLRVMAMTLTGQLHVEDQMVRINVALPWALAMLVERMKPTIEQEGRKLLGNS